MRNKVQKFFTNILYAWATYLSTKTLFALFILFAFSSIYCFYALFSSTTKEPSILLEVTWTREIATEALEFRQHEGWSLPPGASLDYSESRISGYKKYETTETHCTKDKKINQESTTERSPLNSTVHIESFNNSIERFEIT
eukprot:TRINITY_DN1621_c0_g1_i2.p1 TRINITY_DN1621_c0_g1~~TRINITY_DN1621_c0_g1_i2.p1  ORF type:complete len:141 (+),score=13.84 TRINITY_DN1621_c0_g1_i2:44-466(+)